MSEKILEKIEEQRLLIQKLSEEKRTKQEHLEELQKQLNKTEEELERLSTQIGAAENEMGRLNQGYRTAQEIQNQISNLASKLSPEELEMFYGELGHQMAKKASGERENFQFQSLPASTNS